MFVDWFAEVMKLSLVVAMSQASGCSDKLVTVRFLELVSLTCSKPMQVIYKESTTKT